MTSLTANPSPSSLEADASRQLVRLRPRLVPHFPAIVFILTTLLLPIGAINGQNNLLFWIFGLAISALLVSGVLGAWTIASIRVEREPLPPCHAADVTRITYRVTNTSRLLPAFAISISEIPSRPRAIRPPRPEPTWQARFTRGVAFVELIPRNSTVTLHADVAALSRGVALFDAVEVWTSFPFGLSRKTMLQARTQTAVVAPRIAPVKPEFLAMLASLGNGVSQIGSNRTGMGDEFHSLRELSDGDPPRSIAWKRSAATDRLLVRQTARPVHQKMWIGIGDLSRLAPAQSEHALAAAASLAVTASTAGYAVGMLGSATQQPLTPRNGQRAVHELLDVLSLLDPQSHQPPAPVAGLRAAVVLIDPNRGAWPTGGIVASPDEVIGPVPGPPKDSRATSRILGLVTRLLRRSAGLPEKPAATQGSRA